MTNRVAEHRLERGILLCDDVSKDEIVNRMRSLAAYVQMKNSAVDARLRPGALWWLASPVPNGHAAENVVTIWEQMGVSSACFFHHFDPCWVTITLEKQDPFERFRVQHFDLVPYITVVNEDSSLYGSNISAPTVNDCFDRKKEATVVKRFRSVLMDSAMTSKPAALPYRPTFILADVNLKPSQKKGKETAQKLGVDFSTETPRKIGASLALITEYLQKLGGTNLSKPNVVKLRHVAHEVMTLLQSLTASQYDIGDTVNCIAKRGGAESHWKKLMIWRGPDPRAAAAVAAAAVAAASSSTANVKATRSTVSSTATASTRTSAVHGSIGNVVAPTSVDHKATDQANSKKRPGEEGAKTVPTTKRGKSAAKAKETCLSSVDTKATDPISGTKNASIDFAAKKNGNTTASSGSMKDPSKSS